MPCARPPLGPQRLGSCRGRVRRKRYDQSQVSREAWSAGTRVRPFCVLLREACHVVEGASSGAAAGDPQAAAWLRVAPRGAARQPVAGSGGRGGCCRGALRRAAFAGDFGLPGWVLSGSPDAARQILIAIAAAIIPVVVVVSFMVIVALALASGQFGPLMLRNFIRDRGTQVTLGTFVATFVYAVLALGAIGEGGPGFVPHISVTVTLALTVADLAVLVYFVDHITTQIQLPQVIAGIAGDLAEAIELQAGRGAAGLGARSAARLLAGMDGPGGEVAAPRSGYLQYIQHALDRKSTRLNS